MPEDKNKETSSVSFRAGKRTYFLDVKLSAQGAKYLRITESKKEGDGNFLKNNILIYEEDIPAFATAMREILKELNWKKE